MQVVVTAPMLQSVEKSGDTTLISDMRRLQHARRSDQAPILAAMAHQCADLGEPH
jgi:hypothetical protein